MNPEEITFEKAKSIHDKLFFIGYCGKNFESKLICLSLTCYITNELRKKNKKITCYDVLLKLGKSQPELIKNTSLRALACVCEDLMYGCEEFSTFGIDASEAPKILKNLISEITPF